MPQKDRADRIRNPKGGWAGTSSTDFFYLVEKLHRQAKAEADSLDGNTSSYVWAALPMLLSGLSALVVEQEAMLEHQRVAARVELLLNGSSLPTQFSQLYGVSGDLLDNLKVLTELRNEIIHPAHLATGTPDNWPAELQTIKLRGVLQTSKGPGDYLMLGQMKSLRLLDWAMDVVGQLKSLVLQYHSHP